MIRPFHRDMKKTPFSWKNTIFKEEDLRRVLTGLDVPAIETLASEAEARGGSTNDADKSDEADMSDDVDVRSSSRYHVKSTQQTKENALPFDQVLDFISSNPQESLVLSTDDFILRKNQSGINSIAIPDFDASQLVTCISLICFSLISI